MSNQSIPENKEIDQIFFLDGFKLAEDIYTEKEKPSLLFKSMVTQYNAIDDLITSFSQRCEADNVKIDCKKGCEFCCHQAVFALAHEILLIVVFMHQNFTKDEIREVKNRAQDKLAHTKKLDNKKVLTYKQACPLLKDGACSVYAVRPMSCRIYLSSNVETCKDKFNKKTSETNFPKLFDFVLRAGKNMNEGFVTRLNEIGLKPTENTIEHALSSVLSDPEALMKFIKDEKIFDSFEF